MQNSSETLLHSALRKTALLLLLGVACSLDAQAANLNRNHWIHNVTFSIGAGGTLPTGNTAKIMNPGFNFIESLGYRLNSRWSLPLDFIVSSNGLANFILQQEQQPNGSTVLFTIALNPRYDFWRGKQWGSYITGGGGISIKQVVFTHPSPVYTYGYGYNAEAASKSSVQPAADLGMGITYRFHPDGRFQLFQEARYLDLFTPSGGFPGFNRAGTHAVLLTLGFHL